MEASIPETYRDLFNRRSFAHLATLTSRGTPQVTPVWVDYDGECILVNTAAGRAKDRNMRRNPAVGLSILDPDNPYRFLLIQGEVVAITEEGAREHIDRLAQRYLGRERYEGPPEEVRIVYKIRPDKVIARG